MATFDHYKFISLNCKQVGTAAMAINNTLDETHPELKVAATMVMLLALVDTYGINLDDTILISKNIKRYGELKHPEYTAITETLRNAH